MARYEIGAVYKIVGENETTYYVRLLQGDSYGVFAPFDGELCEDTLATTPYRLYLACNSFPVKRGIWEKCLSSPDKEDTQRWKPPDTANYANFDSVLSLKQHRIFHEGNPYVCDKSLFIQLVKDGIIENIFNRHENIPAFLDNYYDEWPCSYILEKACIMSGTPEDQKEQLKALAEMGFDTNEFTMI